MPMSQDRVIAILRASDDVWSKLKELRNTIMTMDTRVSPEELTRAFEHLWQSAAYYCAPSAETAETIQGELGHFSRVFHKNARDAARLRAQRAALHGESIRPGDKEWLRAKRQSKKNRSADQVIFTGDDDTPAGLPPIAAGLPAGIRAEIDALIDSGALDDDDGKPTFVSPKAPE